MESRRVQGAVPLLPCLQWHLEGFRSWADIGVSIECFDQVTYPDVSVVEKHSRASRMCLRDMLVAGCSVAQCLLCIQASDVFRPKLRPIDRRVSSIRTLPTDISPSTASRFIVLSNHISCPMPSNCLPTLQNLLLRFLATRRRKTRRHHFVL